MVVALQIRHLNIKITPWSSLWKLRYLCNGPCGYRTPGRSLQSPTPKPLGHKGTWTTQSLTLDWFVTLLPPFWNPSPLARATFNQGGNFHSQANPGYRCHQCNGPCGYRTPGRSLQSPTPKPLGHKGTWTTQSLTLDWFVTPESFKFCMFFVLLPNFMKTRKCEN